MDVAELLIDGFGRIHESVHRVLDGLSPEDLRHRVDGEANTIAWLVWHLTRVQDDHVCDAFDVPQVWTSQGWAERFALPFAPSATGYGQHSADVAAVVVPVADLIGYHEEVHARTVGLLGRLQPFDLDRVVDESWDPPVTLGVRLVSVIADDLEHVGQAAYVRGIVLRAGES